MCGELGVSTATKHSGALWRWDELVVGPRTQLFNS